MSVDTSFLGSYDGYSVAVPFPIIISVGILIAVLGVLFILTVLNNRALEDARLTEQDTPTCPPSVRSRRWTQLDYSRPESCWPRLHDGCGDHSLTSVLENALKHEPRRNHVATTRDRIDAFKIAASVVPESTWDWSDVVSRAQEILSEPIVSGEPKIDSGADEAYNRGFEDGWQATKRSMLAALARFELDPHSDSFILNDLRKLVPHSLRKEIGPVLRRFVDSFSKQRAED